VSGTTSAATIRALPRIVGVTVTDDTLSADLEDGRTISVPIGWYPRLAYATPAERASFQIVEAGFGVHWPDLDEDMGAEGLLLGKRSNESAASFKRWLDRREQQKGHKEEQDPAGTG
jgi:Protein of unknown function (DUF2442)